MLVSCTAEKKVRRTKIKVPVKVAVVKNNSYQESEFVKAMRKLKAEKAARELEAQRKEKELRLGSAPVARNVVVVDRRESMSGSAGIRKFDVAASLPSSSIKEVTISENPEQGIFVDDSIVDDFEEKYQSIEEPDFADTEEGRLIAEIARKLAPFGLEDQNADPEALKEFERLQKLKGVTSKNDLKALQHAESDAARKTGQYDVPVVINKRVEYFIAYFQRPKMRKIFARWLSRSTKYLPMMRKIFKDKGLPQDLTYLAMIESGFNTSAYSKAHAVGPWQFIKSTGKNYKLKIDYWVDERRDPEKATIAAANYLSDLHDMFGSWYLAAAAYNAGEGKIGRGIKKHKTEDFWELSKYKYLKRETKNYIPKYLAAMIIAKNPNKYGFNNIKPMSEYSYETVSIKEPTDLDVIARSAGVSLKNLKKLNPELRRWYTPPETKSYKVKLPRGKTKTFLANFKQIKPSDKINFMTYRIKHGETLSQVARRFGTKVSSIMKVNKIRRARRVRAGVELIIPIRKGAKGYNKRYASKINKSKLKLIAKGKTVTYTVKRGDTLWDIASESGVEVTDIIKLNNIRNSLIKPGMKLYLYKEPKKIYAKKKSTTATRIASNTGSERIHSVSRGDSLWSISRKYNVSIKELRKMNNLSKRAVIKSGQKLIIATAATQKVRAENIRVASIASSKAKFITYKVKTGDTLWTIARKHKSMISEIKSLNNLKSNKIKPGDTLKIKLAEI